MTVSGSELKSILERIEKLEDEKQNLQEDIKEVYKEARFKGFEPKIIKVILRERKMETNDLEEQQSLLELYRSVLD